jgi:hypothetical protein
MIVHPRPFGESLNEWFRSLGRNWRPLLRVSLVVFVPLGVVVGAVFVVTGAGQSLTNLVDPDYLEGLTDEQVLTELLPLFWASGIWLLAQAAATVYVNLAVSRIVAADLAKASTTQGDAERRALAGFGPGLAALLVVLLGAALIVSIPVLAGWALVSAFGAGFLTVFATTVLALTALVVLVWLGVSVAFYAQVIALDNGSPITALTRSFSLVSARWWVTLGFLLVTSLIVSAAGQVFSVVVVPVFLFGAFEPLILAVAYGITIVLYGPLTSAIAVAYAIWYVDLRARQARLSARDLI